MSDISRHEKAIKELFIGKCWEYLCNNFHKFNEANRIKIALELCKKNIPTELAGELAVTQMPKVTIGEKEQDIQIGTDAP